MKRVRITALKQAIHQDLIDRYENPIEHACDLKVGAVFVSENYQKPNGFCSEAWKSLVPFVMALSSGAEDFFDGWMKDKKTAMVSCSDGFRPMSFLLEAID